MILIKNLYSKISTNLNYLKEFIKGETPFNVVLFFYLSKRRQKKYLKKYENKKNNFKKQIKNLQLSSNWFSPHIPNWLLCFDDLNFESKAPLKYLEIGSWEGLSSFFILNNFPNSRITCVDSWEGGIEHQNKFNLNQVEKNFDFNISKFVDRITKFKGSSFSFFEKNHESNFDLIYVDGSHYCDDVIVDAFKSFNLLKSGGVLIFDDYMWFYYDDDSRNKPIGAINAFLKLKKGEYKLLQVTGQLMIRKN